MKPLKKTALDFNPALGVISPSLPHNTTQHIYELPVQAEHIAKTPKKWYQPILNWRIYFDSIINRWQSQQNNTHLPAAYESKTPATLPIIKATTPLNTPHASQKSITANTQQLQGQTILCVGGRACLYSEYCATIQALGGELLTFHGNVNDSIEHLYKLLSQVDMVICPVDCVRHDLFFAVKYFCKYTNKPYALLDRSEINTFRKGAEVLAYRH